MTEAQKLRVFLSYTHADVSPIRKLYQDLSAQGYDVWFDEENLIPGQEWKTEIERALENSDVVVVCLSTNSVSREGYVQREFRYAMEKALEMTDEGIFLIPVRLNECKVPPKLSRYHWVDLFTDNGFNRLQKALTLRASQVHPAPVPAPAPIPVPQPVVPPKKPTEEINTPQEKFFPNTASPVKDVKPASFFPLIWSLTYLPLIPAIIFLIIGSAHQTVFENSVLYALLAVFAASAFQWWILRPQFQKAFRWVPFNLLISLFILAFHWVSEFTYEGLTEWLMNRHVSFDYYSFWALSFWVILLVWTAINIYAGVLIARSDPRIKLFFSDAKLNISFWNQWGTVLFAGLLAGLLLLNNFGGTLGLGILGIALGFSQWLVLRRHLTSWWWIVINLVFGLLSGWALAFDTNGGYVGVFIDNLFILLWFILNISAGPLLVRSAAKRQTTGAQVKTA